MAYFYLSFLGELFRCSMGEMEKNRNMEEKCLQPVMVQFTVNESSVDAYEGAGERPSIMVEWQMTMASHRVGNNWE